MTSIGFGPPWRVDGPPPIAPLYGLLPAAMAPAAGVRIVVDLDNGAADLNDLSLTEETMPQAIARLKGEGILPAQAGQERWMNSIEVYSYPSDDADVFDTCATPGSDHFKVMGGEIAKPRFSAFTVYYAETCTSYHVWDQDAFIARATATLAAVESRAIARVLRDGYKMPLNPHLSDGNAVILNGGAATSSSNALALLEQAIGETGRMGLVHASPQYATTLRERFAVDNKTGVIRTINGIVVVPDFGYADASKPDKGASPSGTQEWIYASGPVDIRRSEMFVMPDDVDEAKRLAQALDRGTGATTGFPNSITYRAERYYLVIWDTVLQAAVLSDRCMTTCT